MGLIGIALACAGIAGAAVAWVLRGDSKRATWRVEAEAFRQAAWLLGARLTRTSAGEHELEVAFDDVVVRVESGALGLTQWRQVRYAVEGVPDLKGAAPALVEQAQSAIRALAEHGEAKLRGGRLELIVPRRAAAAKAVEAAARAMARAANELRTLGEERRASLEKAIADPATRRQAFLELAAAFPAVAARIAPSLLVAPDPVVRAVAAAQLGEAGLTTLRALLESEDAEAIVAAASAPGLARDAEAEESLIAQLRHPLAQVRIAAAAALGASGSVRAVEPLIRETHGILVDPDARKAALDAIAAIQSRLPNAEPGRLTLTEPTEAGALSLTDAEPGAVDLVEPHTNAKPT